MRVLESECESERGGAWVLLGRFLLFAAGLFVMSLGVALSTRCHLGTSPISSSPYVLSLGLPWSMGFITMVVNILFVLIQIALLRSRFEWIQLLQVVVAVAFGYFTNLALPLVAGLNPGTYIAQWGWILISCMVVALGITMEVGAKVLMMSGEGLVGALSELTGSDFGTVKIWFDISLVACAGLFSFCLFGKLRGVREGTVAAAFLVGSFVRVFRWLGRSLQEQLS